MKKIRLFRSLLCLLLIVAFCSGLTAFADDAEEETASPEDAGPQAVHVYLDGLLFCRGWNEEGVVYLSVEDLGSALGLRVECDWDEESGAVHIAAPGLELSASPTDEYLCANYRYFYLPDHFLRIGDRAYFPVEVMQRLFNVSISVSEDGLAAEISSRGMELLSGGIAWYSDRYDPDDLFWLAHIIHAEAGNQSMAGKIGVGNVVLNRVENERFPDNVHDVIFDQNITVQFQPTINGTVYYEPNELSTVAMYLCLEGYNTVGDSIFFVNPRIVDDEWFRGTKEYVITIGAHDFYKFRS